MLAALLLSPLLGFWLGFLMHRLLTGLLVAANPAANSRLRAAQFVTAAGLAFAHGAIVYHKEGHSIGSSGTAGQRSPTAEYYLMRSRLAFVKRRQPLLLPVHWAVSVGMIGRRLLRRQPDKAKEGVRLFGDWLKAAF